MSLARNHQHHGATGLDLLDFPSICWYQTDYSVYTMRQASRRSWRPGQRRPVEVTYLAYQGTLQERALGLVAAKVKAALIVEGELPDDGLAGLDGDDHDQVIALAKRLVDPDAADDESLEAMFAETRALEAEAEETLDEAHRLDLEPPAPPALFAAANALPPLTRANPFAIAVSDPPVTDGGQLGLALHPGVSDAPIEHAVAAEVTDLPAPVGRIVRFEDLAALTRPRKGRGKAVPPGQLDLFAS